MFTSKNLPADACRQPLLSTRPAVLLQYTSRFHRRRFPTGPVSGPGLLSRFETPPATYPESAAERPLPAAQHVAEALAAAATQPPGRGSPFLSPSG